MDEGVYLFRDLNFYINHINLIVRYITRQMNKKMIR